MALLTTIIAAYEDNADYAEVNSIAQAKAFVTACRRLIVKLPQRTRGGGGEETEFSTSDIRAELGTATRWLSMHDSTGDGRGVGRTKVIYGPTT